MQAKDEASRPKPISAATTLAAAAVAALAGFVAVYVTLMGQINDASPPAPDGARVEAPAPPASPEAGRPAAPSAPAAGGPLAGLNTGAVAAFLVHAEPRPVPDFAFADGDGEIRALADWRGKVVLLNLWATWCAPCREEMPSLDRLKAKVGAEDFDVVALASERGGADKPRAFLKEIDVERLALYHDATARVPATLKAFGLPATLLIDRDGREIGRLVGPAEWDAPEAVRLIEAALGR